MAERPKSKDEEEDDDVWPLFVSRVTNDPARIAAEIARSLQTAPKAASPAPEITRRDLNPEFNEELRKDYDRGPRSRGQRYFDQSPESKDFRRLKTFVEEAAPRTKKIDFTEAPETHESRRLHRQMRAETKGAQHKLEQNLRDYMRMVEEGYVKGGGKFGWKTTAKRAGAKALFRGAPILGAGYTGFQLGSAVSSAGKRNKGRNARREVYEQRQERMRDVFPGKADDFYRQMAQQMGKEDRGGHKVRNAEEVMRIFELQKEIEGIKEGTN